MCGPGGSDKLQSGPSSIEHTKMKDYSKFDAIDFSQDESFIRWVRYGISSAETEQFWQEWLRQNPEKHDEIAEARRLVLAVLSDFSGQRDIQLKEASVWARLEQSIANEPRKETGWNMRYKVAAAILLLVAASVGLWWVGGPESSESSIKLAEATELITISNAAEAPRSVTLPDGSIVELHAKSTLYYPSGFGDVREVQLVGEAFFDVAKNPKKPFVVYTDNLVTKVLGTSFLIRAFDQENKVTVQVKTGQVSVSKKSAKDSNAKEETDALLLTPNQQAIYTRKGEELVKSLVENPLILESGKNVDFQFVDTPLHEVFKHLETAYGVEIVFDDEVLGDCALNASLNGLGLYEKMRLICMGVNAKFEVLDSHIVVSGQGCK